MSTAIYTKTELSYCPKCGDSYKTRRLTTAYDLDYLSRELRTAVSCEGCGTFYKEVWSFRHVEVDADLQKAKSPEESL